MGGRHPKFYAEVDLAQTHGRDVEDVARAHGLVVLVGPARLGLTAPEQVEAIKARFPGLAVEDKAPPHRVPQQTKKHSAGFEKICEEARGRIREITAEEALRRVQSGGVRFIDVREDHEWSEGHAAGAEHLGRGVLERDIEGKVPDRSQEIILYCGGGFRSALAAESLQRMGYTRVLSMAGGYRHWRDAGLPEER
jgi:rhodanese-related sulfurtransferase